MVRLKPALQRLVSVDGDRYPLWRVRIRVDVVATDDAFQFPSVGLEQTAKVACPKWPSYGNVDDSGVGRCRASAYIYRKATFDGLVDILQEFLEGVALRGAAGDRRHLGPISAFLGFVNYHLELHYRRCLCRTAPSAWHVTPTSRRTDNPSSASELRSLAAIGARSLGRGRSALARVERRTDLIDPMCCIDRAFRRMGGRDGSPPKSTLHPKPCECGCDVLCASATRRLRGWNSKGRLRLVRLPLDELSAP